MNQKDRMEKVKQCTEDANRNFFSHNRELSVYFQRPTLDDALVAWVRLNKAEELATTEPSVEFYKRTLEQAFLTLFDKQVLNPIVELSSLAWDAVEEMRRNTGIGLQAMQVKAPAPQLTEEQKLEQTIRDDWKNLPTAAIRKKCDTDPRYKSVFDKIAGSLDSVGGVVTLR